MTTRPNKFKTVGELPKVTIIDDQTAFFDKLADKKSTNKTDISPFALYTISEVSKIINRSRMSVYRYEKCGLRFKKKGGINTVLGEDLLRWLRRP